jgi:hypothetical protein
MEMHNEFPNDEVRVRHLNNARKVRLGSTSSSGIQRGAGVLASMLAEEALGSL